MNEVSTALIGKIKSLAPSLRDSEAKSIAEISIRGALKEMLILDEKMCDEIIAFGKQIPKTEEESIEAWEETLWHKIIQQRVNGLRNLLADLRS